MGSVGDLVLRGAGGGTRTHDLLFTKQGSEKDIS